METIAEVLNMVTALVFIVIIIISGTTRKYLKRKFNVQPHIEKVERAARRNAEIKTHTSVS